MGKAARCYQRASCRRSISLPVRRVFCLLAEGGSHRDGECLALSRFLHAVELPARSQDTWYAEDRLRMLEQLYYCKSVSSLHRQNSPSVQNRSARLVRVGYPP